MTLITRRHSLALLGAAMATPATSEPIYLNSSGVAIRGFDPVSFFTEEDAIKGSIDHELKTDHGLWRFETDANLQRFKAAPEEFMPQFGGYCADGIARGFKRGSDPTVWVMVRGKLYMHYSIAVQNVWAEDIRGNIGLANENWPKLKDTL